MNKCLVSVILGMSTVSLSGCVFMVPIVHSEPALPFKEVDDATSALVALSDTCPGDHWSGGTEGEVIDEVTCDGGFEAVNTKYFFEGSEPGRFIMVLTDHTTCDEVIADSALNSPESHWVFGSDWIVESQSEQFSVDVLAEAVGGERINFAEWACGENGFINDH